MQKAIITALLLALFPAVALAHAVPLESVPASSALLESAPASVEIRFSERIDEGASRITVRSPDGSVVSGDAAVSSEDERTLVVEMQGGDSGAYTVEWGVVSRDDGHFTRGSYVFGVGDASLELPSASQTEIVQIATTPEIIGSSIELFGHGLLWALFILFALAVRPYIATGAAQVSVRTLARLYAACAALGVALVALGGGLQIWFKARDLAQLQGATFYDALVSYAGTAAGEATVLRLAAGIVFLVLVLVFRNRIVAAPRFSLYEWAIAAVLLFFAWQRGAISHATANYFYPDLSILINTLHLIEKDIWAGALSVLFVCIIYRPTRELAQRIAPSVYKLLSWNLVGITLTGSYIAWLHLRDFGNLTTTEWGIEFVGLLIVAVALVGVRLASIALRTYAPTRFDAAQLKLIAVELALALSVIYASCAVIITSPPQQDVPTPTYTERSEGAKISLGVHPYRDGYMRIQIQSDNGAQEPAARLTPEGGSAIELDLEKQYLGSYSFPSILLQPDIAYRLDVTVPQRNAYDATAIFEIPAGTYATDSYGDTKRRADAFTLTMLILALAGAVFFTLVALRTNRSALDPERGGTRVDALRVVEALAVACVVLVAVALSWRVVPLLQSYKLLCEYDGNMWHVMLPMKAGVPESVTPREGCMWGMGSYQYMFAEKAEYEYFRSLPPASVSVTFASEPVAGTPTPFTVSIRTEDGEVPPLFVDMEKIIHVVIVSRDQSVFAHIHPDDSAPLTEDAVRTGTFELSYSFPRSGEYLISIDYANGITLESHQERVVVQGDEAQDAETTQYQMPRDVGPYTVTLEYSQPFAGEVATLVYNISQSGRAAELEPYLSAAMHIAVVKNDFGAFVHTHGEVHPPGTDMPPVMVRDGNIVHSMASMATPPKFSYPVDAHVIFPEPGLYTVWAQFQSEGVVYAVPASVRVE